MTSKLIKVLIIDDSDEDLYSIKRAVKNNQDYPIQLIATKSGEQGIALIKSECPDCILLDYRLPDMDGLEFLQKVKDDNGHLPVPVIFISGQGNEKIAAQALKSGVSDYLIKDEISGNSLVRSLRYALKKHIDEKKIKAHYTFFQVLLNTIPNPIYYKDGNGRFEGCNDSFEKFIGMPQKGILGKTVYDFAPKEMADKYHEMDSTLLENPGIQIYEAPYHHPDGTIRHVIFNQASFSHLGEKVDGIVGIISDITDHKIKEKRIQQLALYDPLTKLPNRNLFYDRLKSAVAQAWRNQSIFALLFIDLDGFKPINDTLGHEAGDTVLKVIAHRLMTGLRKTDTAARLGGDEFTVILQDLKNKKHIKTIVEKILESIRQPIRIDQTTNVVRASIGISVFPNDTQDPDDLVKKADTAMYRVKSIGKNNYAFFMHRMDNAAQHRAALCSRLQSLCSQLDQAFMNNEFFLEYQPWVDIITHQILGFEALLRWRHPTDGIIMPDTFLPFLEELGLIDTVNFWVLRQACNQFMTWQQRLISPMMLAINFSSIQFRVKTMAQKVEAILNETGMALDHFQLEIKEGLFDRGDHYQSDSLFELKEIGIKHIILDDFGIGNAAISHLRNFPINGIKIDQTFIKDILTNEADSKLVCAMASMGLGLNLTSIVAEGVEQEEQLPILRRAGCNAYQGYLFSPSLAAEKVPQLISASAAHSNQTQRRQDKNQGLGPLRILLVEDYQVNIQITTRYLESAGYRVDSVLDGHDAIAAVRQSRYDLIIMDLELPQLNGLEATKKIRAEKSAEGIPIIAFTSYDDIGTRESCLRVGMNDFLLKPIKKKELLSMMDKWKP